MGRHSKHYDVMDKSRFVELIGFYTEDMDKATQNLVSLANRAGCHKSTIYRYIITDDRELSSEIVKKICEVTGVSMDWLYGLSDEKYLKRKQS